MSERRTEQRKKLMAFTPVYDLHPRVLLGYLGDLTLHGLLVIGSSPVAINKETTLEIRFPGEIFNQTIMPVKIPARIAWCRPNESPQYYDIGVQFTNVTPEQEELLQRILERYHFRHVAEDADIEPST